MTTKKSIDEAWKVHDTTEPNCESDKSYWNKNLGHSHYNLACQRWVNKYAFEHPVQEVITTTEKPKTEKVKCSGCKKLLNVSMMRSQFGTGEYACSARCEDRIVRKHEEKKSEEKLKKKATDGSGIKFKAGESVQFKVG